ncbi:MAG: hypothetical protein J0M26_20295 [Planctomycetes bacterium]|nr:hypothetical protein [Planctomycetota bacterium]
MTERKLVGKLIRHLRDVRGWTQENLASRISCQREMISLLESGKKGSSELQVQAIAQLLSSSDVKKTARQFCLSEDSDEFLKIITEVCSRSNVPKSLLDAVEILQSEMKDSNSVASVIPEKPLTSSQSKLPLKSYSGSLLKGEHSVPLLGQIIGDPVSGYQRLQRDKGLLANAGVLYSLSTDRGYLQQAEDAIDYISNFLPDEEYFTQWHDAADLQELAELGWAIIDVNGIVNCKAAVFLQRAGRLFREVANPAFATNYLSAAQKMAKDLGEANIELACMVDLGRLALERWDFGEAERKLKVVVDRRESDVSSHPLILAQGHSLYSLALSGEEKLESAKAHAEKAFELSHPLNGDWGLHEYAWSCLNYSHVISKLEGSIKAYPYYESARNAMKKELKHERDHPLLALFDQKEADILAGLSKKTEAVKTAEKAILSWQSSYGELHPRLVDLVITYAKTANGYVETKQLMTVLEKADYICHQSVGLAETRQHRKVKQLLQSVKV